MLRKLMLYGVLRSFSMLTSVFQSPREAISTILLIIIIIGGIYIWQDQQQETLFKGAETNDVKMIDEAVGSGALLSVEDYLGRTALHIAARYSSVDAVRRLLEMGASVHARDNRGRTPLHITRYDQSDNVEIVKLLLAYGANPDIEDFRGQRPIDIIRKQPQYTKHIEYLLTEYARRQREEE